MPNANVGMSLGKMVTVLVAALHKQDVRLPFKDQEPWHLLFYSLKTRPAAPGKPPFLDELVFDWDGPYPKCEDLADFLNGLHVTANVSALNPHFDAITVDDADADRWWQDFNGLDSNSQSFVTQAVDLARREFQHAAG